MRMRCVNLQFTYLLTYLPHLHSRMLS